MTRHPSFPVTLKVDWTGGTGYATTIGQPRDVEGPPITRNEIEVPADHDLPDNYLLVFPGVSSAGEIAFPINLDPSMAPHVEGQGTGILGSFEDLYNGTSLPRFQYQNTGMEGGTATLVFRGFFKTFEMSFGKVEGSMEANCAIRISGKPTLTVT